MKSSKINANAMYDDIQLLQDFLFMREISISINKPESKLFRCTSPTNYSALIIIEPVTMWCIIEHGHA